MYLFLLFRKCVNSCWQFLKFQGPLLRVCFEGPFNSRNSWPFSLKNLSVFSVLPLNILLFSIPLEYVLLLLSISIFLPFGFFFFFLKIFSLYFPVFSLDLKLSLHIFSLHEVFLKSFWMLQFYGMQFLFPSWIFFPLWY